MITDVLGEIVSEVIGGVILAVGGAVTTLFGPSRRREPAPPPRDVFVPPRPPSTESAMSAVRDRYEDWARERGLRPVDGSQSKHAGRVDGREIRFDTGVSGSAAREPDIVVLTGLASVATAVLVTRESSRASRDAVAWALLDEIELVRAVGLAGESIRIAFFHCVDPEAFDAALEVIARELRPSAPSPRPYR
jgi:hypothetical protein